MRIFTRQSGRRAVGLLALLAVLWAGTLPGPGSVTGAGFASLGRSLELPLRDLSAWLAPVAGHSRRPPVTLGLRN